MMSTARKPYCFTDFDGTLTDNRQRLFRFYTEHIPEEYRGLLTVDAFWEMKRNGIHEIANLEKEHGARIDRAAYDAEKKRVIENEEYLLLDEVFPFAKEALENIRQKYEPVLLTRRSHEDAFLREWERTGLGPLFTAVHVIPHSYGTKAEFIAKHYDVDPSKDVIVGDTEDDVRAGEELGIRAFLVLSGIRGDWIVRKYFAGYADRIRVITDIRETD